MEAAPDSAARERQPFAPARAPEMLTCRFTREQVSGLGLGGAQRGSGRPALGCARRSRTVSRSGPEAQEAGWAQQPGKSPLGAWDGQGQASALGVPQAPLRASPMQAPCLGTKTTLSRPGQEPAETCWVPSAGACPCDPQARLDKTLLVSLGAALSPEQRAVPQTAPWPSPPPPHSPV